MSGEKLVETLEKYSNAIVGFIVLQSIAFSTLYGANAHFSCLVNTMSFLAPGLILHFVISTALACGAIVSIKNTIQRIGTEYLEILNRIYWAKIIVVILFAGLPVILLAIYGLGYSKNYADCLDPLR